MAYKLPTVPVPPNPVFLDKAIAEIQTVLGAVSWLTYSFGRSYNKVDFAGGNRGLVPMVYKGSSEYLPVQFNDNLQAQSFFVVGSQEVEGGYDDNTLNFYKVPTSIIVWANLKKIDSTKGNNYYFAEELKKDIRVALRNSTLKFSDFGTPSIDENIDAIFSDYTFTQDTYQYFSYPYVAFRFNLELIISEIC